MKRWSECVDYTNGRQVKAAPNMVAAGDPANNLDDDGRLIRLEKQLPVGYTQFIVCGISMTPKGIDDGDNIVCRPIADSDFPMKKGTFLIIKVDPAYYKMNALCMTTSCVVPLWTLNKGKRLTQSSEN